MTKSCVKISLKCESCLRIFKNRAISKIHHAKAACQKRIECEKCGVRLKEEKYKKHIMRSCVKVECEKCGEKFSPTKLNLHLQRKRSCVVQEPKCEDCSKTFSTSVAAKTHMRNKKGTCNMQFGCEGCGNVFNGNGRLKMHQRLSKKCLPTQQKCDRSS